MSDFRFCYFTDYAEGKMARLETLENSIPVNIHAEPDSDFDLMEDDLCSIDVIGVGSDIMFYDNEDEFEKAGTMYAPVSMIPMGIFPADGNYDGFSESPYIIFTGKIINVETDTEAGPDDPNYCVTVETLDMSITVFLQYEGVICEGGILHGIAWLYGDVLKTENAPA